MTSAELPPHPAWPALVNPHRFAEARQAIKQDPTGLLAARGLRWGETAMHWVGMSDPGNWIELVAAGGNPNATDRLGRTPLDWISDRLWLGALAPHQRLGEPSRDRIRVATTRHAPAVWAAGGRPGHGPHSLPPVKLWIETGLWDLVSLAQDEPALWHGFGPEQTHALHAWVEMADRLGAAALLDRILATGLPVDAPDAQGRSALGWAIAGWLRSPAKAAPFRQAIIFLRSKGADPDAGLRGQAPSLLLQEQSVSPQLHQAISALLDG